MDWPTAFARYNNNLFRQLSDIHRYVHQTLNDRLVKEGYHNFKMDSIYVIPYLVPQGLRLTDLVELHQTPKATLARLINRLHHQGFIEKCLDPLDNRANKLFITDKGITLIERAAGFASETMSALADLMGERAFAEFTAALAACSQQLALQSPPARQFVEALATKYDRALVLMQLNALVRFIDLKMLEAIRLAGYNDLPNSHRAVLSHIRADGSRATDIAQKEGLSKQSISDIIYVLVKAKYLKRVPDPQDKRAYRLVLAERGQTMIMQAMEQLVDVEQQLAQLIGADLYQTFALHTERLWFLLGGKSPETAERIHFSQMDDIIQPWLHLLLKDLQENQAKHLSRVFYHDGDQYQLQPGFLQYLQLCKID